MARRCLATWTARSWVTPLTRMCREFLCFHVVVVVVVVGWGDLMMRTLLMFVLAQLAFCSLSLRIASMGLGGARWMRKGNARFRFGWALTGACLSERASVAFCLPSDAFLALGVGFPIPGCITEMGNATSCAKRSLLGPLVSLNLAVVSCGSLAG